MNNNYEYPNIFNALINLIKSPDSNFVQIIKSVTIYIRCHSSISFFFPPPSKISKFIVAYLKINK